jgi:hypothetical protein
VILFRLHAKEQRAQVLIHYFCSRKARGVNLFLWNARGAFPVSSSPVSLSTACWNSRPRQRFARADWRSISTPVWTFSPAALSFFDDFEFAAAVWWQVVNDDHMFAGWY